MKLKFRDITFLIAILFLLQLAPFFLGSGNPSYLVIGSVGIFLLISIPKYMNKRVLYILIVFILFSGLILSYTYIFKPIFVQTYEYNFAIVIFIINVILFIVAYKNRDSEFPLLP